MTKGMVSVIIPVYNREQYIEECVHSVQAQTYQNFEILLIDDGSTDNSLAVCQALAEKDNRIHLLHGEHQGVSAARNLGLSAVEGEYVFFLDSDDVIYPALFATLTAGFENTDAGMAASKEYPVKEESWQLVQKKLQEEPVTGQTKYFSHQETLDSVFSGPTPLRCIGGVMMRTELIGDTRFRTDLFVGEDFYFIYENLIKGCAAIFLRPKWYYARFHANNSSLRYDFDGFWTRFYRRLLVWRSEESFGRKKNADHQKRSAFGAFINCFGRSKPFSSDRWKIRKTLLQYSKEVFPSLTRKGKLLFIGYAVCPLLAAAIQKKKHT